MRTPLGDGWYLVTDDRLLYAPPDPEGRTAAGRRAWHAHDRALAAYFAGEPDVPTIHLEGPAGLSVAVPFDSWEDALSELGIKRKRRRPPGPMTLDKQRALVSRVQSGETPDTYQGKANAALKEEVLRREWVLAAEFENLLAVRETMPDRFAQLPPEEQAAVNAYARTREAAGRGDDPLPKIAVESFGAPRSMTAREEAQGWTLNR